MIRVTIEISGDGGPEATPADVTVVGGSPGDESAAQALDAGAARLPGDDVDENRDNDENRDMGPPPGDVVPPPSPPIDAGPGLDGGPGPDLEADTP